MDAIGERVILEKENNMEEKKKTFFLVSIKPTSLLGTSGLLGNSLSTTLRMLLLVCLRHSTKGKQTRNFEEIQEKKKVQTILNKNQIDQQKESNK
jgi:hypothetical protein